MKTIIMKILYAPYLAIVVCTAPLTGMESKQNELERYRQEDQAAWAGILGQHAGNASYRSIMVSLTKKISELEKTKIEIKKNEADLSKLETEYFQNLHKLEHGDEKVLKATEDYSISEVKIKSKHDELEQISAQLTREIQEILAILSVPDNARDNRAPQAASSTQSSTHIQAVRPQPSLQNSDEALAKALQEDADAAAAQQLVDHEESSFSTSLPHNEDAALATYLQDEENKQIAYHVPAYQPVIFPPLTVDTRELIALPASLRSLDKADIYDFVTLGQKSADCGPRAVANALGLQDSIKSHDNLSSANQRTSSATYNHLAGENVPDDTITKFASQQGLANPFLIAYHTATWKPGNPKEIAVTSANFSGVRDNQPGFDDIKYIPDIVVNFIGNTGGHWIAITVIKQRAKKPIIIHMDTSKSPIPENCPTVDFIRFIYTNCLGL